MADFDSRNVGLRAQKKLLGKMSSKRIAKVFIDDTTGRTLDNLYRLAKDYTKSKKVAEKLTKNLIKTVIKVGILYRNDQLSHEEVQIAENFRKKFRTIAMTVLSFYEVDFTFDKNYLMQALQECSDMLKDLVCRHLTEKSLQRIEHVFDFYSNADFLESVFHPNSPYKSTMDKVCLDLNSMIEQNII